MKAPGTVYVNREYDELTVTCEKEGYETKAIKVGSSTKGMAFGNIILGGVVGAGVDMATGAAYDYPAEIISPLNCRSPSQVASAQTMGHYDKEALALVDTNQCDIPTFAAVEGEKEICRSKCSDGKVGVISCTTSGCVPVNVSEPAKEG